MNPFANIPQSRDEQWEVHLTLCNDKGKMWAVAETVYTSDSDNILCNFYLRLYIFKIKKHQIAGIWHNLYLYYCQDKIVECRLFKKKISSLPLLSNSACCFEVSINTYIMIKCVYFRFSILFYSILFYSIILFSFPSKNDEKTYYVFQKNIKQHNCFIADRADHLLSSKLSYQNDFW